MKALVLEAYNKLVYEDVPKPTIAGDEVLIEVKACGICGSDVHGMDGSTGRRIPPIIMGHEAAGVIRETGPAVTGWHAGRPRHVRLDHLLRRMLLLPGGTGEPVR